MGFRLSKIYTRTGDKGETGLGDGRRVPKDHPRIEAIGEVDTLKSWAAAGRIGGANAHLCRLSGSDRCFGALPAPIVRPRWRTGDAGVSGVECSGNRTPGSRDRCVERGAGAAGKLHLARRLDTDCPGSCLPQPGAQRRAAVSAIECGEPLAGVGLAYINRLSDLLFVAARLIAKRQGIAEILWQPAAEPEI